MEEKEVLIETAEENGVSSENTGETDSRDFKEEVLIPVKFNKEIKNLNAQEAATLAQKGMKFEMIQNDFEKLRNLALKQKMSVPEYINSLEELQREKRREDLLKECGGNGQIADRILELEDGGEYDEGLEELKKYFPSIKKAEDLPAAVVESARIKGENLLNSYLKYRLLKQKQAAEERQNEQDAKLSSVGSLKSAGAGNSDNDFIKALWGQ